VKDQIHSVVRPARPRAREDAPARCQFCRAPIDQEVFLARTGERWKNNMFIGALNFLRWRMICSNCGAEDDTVEHADTTRPYYTMCEISRKCGLTPLFRTSTPFYRVAHRKYSFQIPLYVRFV
jgi:hypothetical protein